MIDVSQLNPANLATMSAIVAALVTVLGNSFNIPTRYRSLIAIGIGMLLVFLPQSLLNKVLTAFVIGLTASGVYSQVKPLNLFQKATNGTVPSLLSNLFTKKAPKNTTQESSSSNSYIPSDNEPTNSAKTEHRISAR
ncbi:hypothetical protein [Radiobacillus deserti]|uniref:hypothetical protein n=1 Tax=Radiobacillus deserti TaxID=2594883 RepID=UPI00188ADF4C|nr:hypothetical protein [Radiobacillus deserti]